MKKFTLQDAVAIVIWIIPITYLLITYQSLADTVPTHFGIDGKPDKWGSKNEFLFITLLLMSVAAGAYLLMRFLPQIDPKRKAKYSKNTFNHLGIALLTFISALNIAIIFATSHEGMNMSKLLLPMIGIFFTYLGNIMYSLKPNYFVGIRTPWTLEDEGTWRKTHQLGGKIWLAGGIFITIATLLLPASIASLVFISAAIIMALIPVFYSYFYFKNHRPNKA
jgi:uncharacterized membrane protein